jgi:hypothetical protein
MNLPEINNQKNNGKTKNKKKRNQNNRHSISSQSITCPSLHRAFNEAELLIYEPQLNKQDHKTSNKRQPSPNSGWSRLLTFHGINSPGQRCQALINRSTQFLHMPDICEKPRNSQQRHSQHGTTQKESRSSGKRS